jgi:tetratricopeptide (TPR) repeat protein
MGDEIELRGSSDDFSNIVEANQPLQGRITALAYISAGLSQYVADDYEGALELFEQAQSVSQWTDDQGREVVYVLLGNAHLRLASEGAFHGDADTVEEQVALARADYETANGLAEAYSRPYAGLASAYYLAAMAPTYRGEYPDFALLDEAMVQVEQADDALDQPQDIGVNSRWLFTRAQVQFQRWLYGLDFYTDEELGAFYADFDRVSQQIITDYGQGTNPSLSLLASESHIFRGLAFQTNGQCRDALDAYDAALGFELALNRRMFVLGWKGDCHQKRGEQDQATVAYEQALDLAEGLGFDVDANCYQMKLDNIEEEVRCG